MQRLFTVSMLLFCAWAPASAAAQEASPVDFADPQIALREGARFSFSLEIGAARPLGTQTPDGQDLEVAIVAGVPDAFEISLSQRHSIRAADVRDRSERATELRIGRGVLREYQVDENGSSAYAFVASNNDALTWRPDARSAFGGRGDTLALQDRVEVGDLAAGLTYERGGVQASLAYVEREASARVGRASFSQDQRFTGVTITMRH